VTHEFQGLLPQRGLRGTPGATHHQNLNSLSLCVEPMFAASAVVRVVLSVYTKIFADQSAGGNVRMNNVLPGWIDNLPATEGFSGLTGTPTGNIYFDPDGTALLH
jgi:NAD(P)-dependent dehydrogenase (short-subunit alcohol dehydrogenase family)